MIIIVWHWQIAFVKLINKDASPRYRIASYTIHHQLPDAANVFNFFHTTPLMFPNIKFNYNKFQFQLIFDINY